MLKYQVRTLGREKRRQTGPPLRDVFAPNFCNHSTSSHNVLLENTTSVLLEDGGHLPSDSEYNLHPHHHNHAKNHYPGAYSSAAPSPALPMRSISHQHQSSMCNQQIHQQQNFKNRGRSTSVSSLSSSSSSSDPALEWGQVRVYTYLVRPDTTYFTFMVNNSTTADDLVQMALIRLRLFSKDYSTQRTPVYYLTMELSTRQQENSNEVKNVLILDQSAKPLDLQACHPKEKSKFFLQNRLAINNNCGDDDLAMDTFGDFM